MFLLWEGLTPRDAIGIFFTTNGRATRSTFRKYLIDFKLNNIFVPINRYIRLDISIALLRRIIYLSFEILQGFL